MVPSPDLPRDGANTIQQPSNTKLFLPPLKLTVKTPAAISSIVGLPLSNPCNECVLGLKRIANETGNVCTSDVHPLRGTFGYDVSLVHLCTSDYEKVITTLCFCNRNFCRALQIFETYK